MIVVAFGEYPTVNVKDQDISFCKAIVGVSSVRMIFHSFEPIFRCMQIGSVMRHSSPHHRLWTTMENKVDIIQILK